MMYILFFADLHLSDKRPIARLDNWRQATIRVMRQISFIAEKYNAAVVCAGDVFDRWNVKPWLITAALRYLPQMWCVAGQHDIPQHNIENIKESAFWTLVSEGKIKWFGWGKKNTPNIGGADITGINYGEKLIDDVQCDIVVLHTLCWVKNPPYPGAPKDGNYRNIVRNFRSAKLIVCGDNHESFIAEAGDTTVINCGSIFRADADQIDHKPSLWLYNTDDASVKRIYLPTKKDQLSREHIDKIKKRDEQIDGFVDSLAESTGITLSFEENIKRYLESNRVDATVERMIIGAME